MSFSAAQEDYDASQQSLIASRAQGSPSACAGSFRPMIFVVRAISADVQWNLLDKVRVMLK